MFTVFTAPAYANTFLSFDDPSGNRTEALDINDESEVVGTVLTAPDSFVHGFLFNGINFTTVDFEGSRTTAYGINNANQVVGSYGTGNSGSGNGFVWEDGTFTTVSAPGAPATVFHDVNNVGQIVGITRASNGAFSGTFLLESGTFTFLGLPGEAWGINDFGHIVGFAEQSGYLFDGVTTTPINVPGASYTQAMGINNQGQIVGNFGTNGTAKGFLFDGEEFLTFTFPGAADTFAFGINESSEVVGYFRDSQGGPIEHGYLARVDSSNFEIGEVGVIPEPVSAWLFGVGLLGLAGRRNKKITSNDKS